MKCEYCENSIPDGVQRCPSCGAPIRYAKDCINSSAEKSSMQKNVYASTNEVSVHPLDPYLYVNKKSRTIYVVLAIFLGHIGVHNFYAGYIGRGVAQLLITILTFGFLFWISWIWAIIEACAETHDGRSVPFA